MTTLGNDRNLICGLPFTEDQYETRMQAQTHPWLDFQTTLYSGSVQLDTQSHARPGLALQAVFKLRRVSAKTLALSKLQSCYTILLL